MSCGERQYWLVGPCPNCGQQDEPNAWKGARMSSTGWGHGYSCCSDKCGKEYGAKLAQSQKPHLINTLYGQIAKLKMELEKGEL